MPSAALQITTPSDREVRMTRDFHAPRALVFDTLTRPELLRRWYGLEGWELIVCEIDLRPGGAWRYLSRLPNGREVGQQGIYREIAAPEKIVNTEFWDDWNPGEVLVTTLLTEHDGETTLTVTILFPSKEVRDTLIAHGMNNNTAQMYDQLERLLASLS
jgi:uncharacterized protein YndB with AHSA1/START domain